MATKHETKVVDLTKDPSQYFAYRVDCDCGWVGRFAAKQEAELAASRHTKYQDALKTGLTLPGGHL